MPKDQLELFTDRREALALFDLLRGRDPEKPWPLLPILAFIAPRDAHHLIAHPVGKERFCQSR